MVEADRTEAVRQSLFLVLGESTEAAGPDGSRKDVLDRASERLTREFARAAADVVWRRTKLGLRLSSDQVAVLDGFMTEADNRALSPAAE